MRVTTSQYKISGKNHIFSVKTKPPEHYLPAREKKTHWKSSILARAKSFVLLTDPLFTHEIDYITMYPSDRYKRSCWQMIGNYKTRRGNSGPKCLSTGSHPSPLSPPPPISSQFFHPFPKQRACSYARTRVWFDGRNVKLAKLKTLHPETHIPSNMCSPTWETYIPSDMCSPTRETYIPNDMCSPTWETYP